MVVKTEQELREEIETFVECKGVSPHYKGFKIMVELIFQMVLIGKKYTKTTMKELEPQIAKQFKIKEDSIQRALRFSVTINNGLNTKTLPVDLMSEAFHKIKKEKEENKNETINKN